MVALDFGTVLALGSCIAGLFMVASLVLSPTLGDARSTHSLALGNLCIMLMLGLRPLMPTPLPPAGHGFVWTMLLLGSGFHALAIDELGVTRPGRREALARAMWAGTACIWALLALLPSKQPAAALMGVCVIVLQSTAVRSAWLLDDRRLAVPRRALIAVFGANAVFAVKLVAERLDSFVAGIDEIPAVPILYFGSTLLFCVVNLGFLLLMYLQLVDRVNRLAQTDDLTEALARLRTAQKVSTAGSLLLIDIDHFKRVNDTHGHAVGDEVLRWFAVTLRRFMRRDDLLVRMGGEEFCLLLPGIHPAEAARVAERIRVEFAAHATAPTAAGALAITASFGLVAFGHEDTVLDERLRLADEALYAAKRNGRNRVVQLFTAPAVSPETM